MYSSAKRMGNISAIACSANIIGVILFALISASLRISFTASFAIFVILIGSTAATLLLTLGLRSLCQDLETEFEGRSAKLRELNDRITQLENKAQNAK